MATVNELRRVYQEMIPLAGTGDAVRKVETITMHADNPAREIPLRLYYPVQTPQADGLPIFLLIHGGGFVCGNFDTHDVLARAVGQPLNRGYVGFGIHLLRRNKRSIDYMIGEFHLSNDISS